MELKKEYLSTTYSIIFAKILDFVVQLDRMADSGSAGWRFESSRGHKSKARAESEFLRLRFIVGEELICSCFFYTIHRSNR